MYRFRLGKVTAVTNVCSVIVMTRNFVLTFQFLQNFVDFCIGKRITCIRSGGIDRLDGWRNKHGRPDSPPASLVMNFIFWLPDRSRISVDTVHASLPRSSYFSSPKRYQHAVFVFRRSLCFVSSHNIVQTNSVLLSCTSL